MTSKLAKIRDLMIKHSIQGYIIPSGDAHMSEYVAPCDERRAFISEFNGSAGTAFITLKDAYLWTDGRYWLQAQKQLDESWTLKKEGIDLPLTKFLTNDNVHAVDGKFTIGFDPYLYSVDEYKNMAKALADAYRVEFSLKSIPVNLVDEVWGDARPAAPNGKIFRLDDSFSGKSATEKIEEIRNAIIEEGCRNSILTALDEIAWLLNLRGSDINYNPVFFAYLIINDVDVILFVDKSKFEDGVEEYLHSINVTVKPYSDYLETLGQIVNDKYSTEYLIDPKSCNYASFEVLKGSSSTTITEKKSVVTIAKSFKNPVEIKGFRDCHIRDGASIVRYFAWVENELKQGHTINEYDGAVKLEEIRKQNDLFLGLSFSTISAYGKSASIIHYSPSKENSQVIGTDTLYLLDSGAHYKDGTTDTTRTVHFGTPSEEEKLCYTRVLQGHIAIDSLVFPEGVSGLRLDAIARTFLWKDGLDYNHGTGHGVGHALCVHEGPHGIGYRSITYNDFGLKENIIVTNEPGYYEPGRFGIRIENILLAKEVPTKKNFNDKKYIGFEAMTCCPIQPTICEPSLMSDAEISWLNNYNKRVRETLTPLLASDTLALDYLNRATQPLVH